MSGPARALLIWDAEKFLSGLRERPAGAGSSEMMHARAAAAEETRSAAAEETRSPAAPNRRGR